MCARGWILALVATVAVATAEAQIRLIPQAKVDSARNVATEQVGMAFERTTIDFGELPEEGGAWCSAVQWQNAGREQITIIRITTSCGCLQVENDRSTVEAGGRGELRLTYHPKGHAGRVSQRIFVYTDRSGRRPAAVLTVRAWCVRRQIEVATIPTRAERYCFVRRGCALRAKGCRLSELRV